MRYDEMNNINAALESRCEFNLRRLYPASLLSVETSESSVSIFTACKYMIQTVIEARKYCVYSVVTSSFLSR